MRTTSYDLLGPQQNMRHSCHLPDNASRQRLCVLHKEPQWRVDAHSKTMFRFHRHFFKVLLATGRGRMDRHPTRIRALRTDVFQGRGAFQISHSRSRMEPRLIPCDSAF